MTGQFTPEAARVVVRKIALRILPLSIALYVVAFVDRVNLGYAALQMNKALGLTSEGFGFAAGVFFIGNVLFEVPSNLLLLRYGPRKWISRIIFTWGVIATLTAFVQSPAQLYILRFLLGVAEAGFIPGMVFYFSLWFRETERASAIGLFLIAMPLTYVVAAPISTAIMRYVNLWGFEGWRWMLFLEGIPALLGGALCFLLLTDSPEHASWLSAEEKAWLAGQFATEQKLVPHAKEVNARQALANPTILFMALIYFLSQLGALGIGYWLPQIVRNLSENLSLTQVGFISGVPYAVTAIALVIWARCSDKFQERKLFAAIPQAIGAAGLLVAGGVRNPVIAMIAITIALAGIFATKPPFFAMLNQVVTRRAVAVSSAVVTSIGNIGGFVGPYVVGVATRAGHAQKAGLLTLSAALFLSALLTLFIKLENHNEASARELSEMSGIREQVGKK